jgi:hypothetical protein
MRTLWLLLLGLIPVVSGHADSHPVMTLCEPTETVVFSCASSRIGTDPDHSHAAPRKVISLCATPGVTEKSSALVYRFGVDKQHVELTFPSETLPPAKTFTAEWESWAKGSGSRLTFRVGEYSYTLYNRMAVYEETARSNGGGVLVTHRGKLIADHWCDGKELSPAIEDHIWRIVQPLKLPGAERDAP